jgi:hypothetical protein
MSESATLEVVSLSTLYAKMAQPFCLAKQDDPSVSILRGRRSSSIPVPLMQLGPIACRDVPEFSYSEVAVAYLPNAVVTRTGAVIFGDRYIIAETLEGSPEANGIPAGTNSQDIAECPFSDEVIINANKLGMWNYSLFLFEVAPSIMLASLTPGLEKLRHRIFFQPFMKASDIENRISLFKIFGVDEKRILTADSDFCRYRGVVMFKFNDLHRSQRLSQVISPVCASLIESYATGLDNMPKRIYISRQKSSSRKVSNYEALYEQVLKRHDISPLELDDLSLADQVNLFSKANLVVAEHGAGLANIAFMRPGCFVVEAVPSNIATRGVYRYIAAHRHLNYIYTTFQSPENWRWDKDDVVAPLAAYDFLLSRV